MALTLSTVQSYPPQKGGLRQKVVDVTFDTSYPTGGESLTAADLGLSSIKHVSDGKAMDATPTIRSTRYDYVNSKLLAFLSTDSEVGAATDLSGYTARLLVSGV